MTNVIGLNNVVVVSALFACVFLFFCCCLVNFRSYGVSYFSVEMGTYYVGFLSPVVGMFLKKC